MRLKPTKAEAKALRAVRKAIVETYVAKGAQVIEDQPDRVAIRVETAAGPLDLTLYDNWVAGRFHEDRAVFLGLGDTLNRYSLKYNVQGTMESALTDPDGYGLLVRHHIERALNAKLQDIQIEILTGPISVTVTKDLSVRYTGSAVEWLQNATRQVWQQAGVVKDLVTSHMSQVQRCIDDQWCVVRRLRPTP